MKTIHFVYAHGPLKSCPNAISTELTSRLIDAGYRVVRYQWDRLGRIRPAPGDILLGHPSGLPFTYLRRSLMDKHWSRRILLYPFAHGRLDYSSFIDSMIEHCNLFLAITGEYWIRSLSQSRLKHWRPKLRHLDLAVDCADFPFLKHTFNPTGRRRVVYIGSSGSHKNIPYLEQIASQCTDMTFGWIGTGRPGIKGVKRHGYVDFSTEEGKAVICNYDFLLTVGNSDPNPTTILESMAWGLIPVCTPQSGYEESSGVINVPLNDVAAASAVLRRLQDVPEDQLRAIQRANIGRLIDHYNWDRFAAQVIEAIESDESPAVDQQTAFNKIVLRANTMLCSERSSFLRTNVLRYFMKTAITSLFDRNRAERFVIR